MASTGPMNGTAIVLKLGGTTIAKLKSNSMKLDMSAIDVSNKDSAGYKEIIGGQRSGSFDFDGVLADTSALIQQDYFQRSRKQKPF